MTDTQTIDKQKPAKEKQKKTPPSDEHVRPAGPKDAGIDPSDWDKVDEEVDESFPASDAPSNY